MYLFHPIIDGLPIIIIKIDMPIKINPHFIGLCKVHNKDQKGLLLAALATYMRSGVILT